MSLFTDTMTVYNHITDSDTGQESWQRTVVKGVQWQHNKTETTISKGVQTEKKVESITIDFQRTRRKEKYVNFLEFEKLEDKTGFWTLNNRDGLDLVVCGDCKREITDTYRISDLKKDYQYCVTVKSVSDNRNADYLKHIKVVAE